mmetsp:Transcript_47362/g.133642  ORF Transcript_47362/g.133642 Transcript_47362/m.133642 type:complete len:217 (-) Transcript_47362:1621-2271(-)
MKKGRVIRIRRRLAWQRLTNLQRTSWGRSAAKTTRRGRPQCSSRSPRSSSRSGRTTRDNWHLRPPPQRRPSTAGSGTRRWRRPPCSRWCPSTSQTGRRARPRRPRRRRSRSSRAPGTSSARPRRCASWRRHAASAAPTWPSTRRSRAPGTRRPSSSSWTTRRRRRRRRSASPSGASTSTSPRRRYRRRGTRSGPSRSSGRTGGAWGLPGASWRRRT